MFNSHTYENSRPGGIGVLEVVNGKEPDETQPRLFVPLKGTELQGEIIGPLASLQFTQTYSYTRQQCDHVLEAVYRFPLPGDAAVTSVRVRFGEVEIRAELKEREKAETKYQEAKQQGLQAALLTRESPDVFTLQVAGIQPDQDITVETAYVQLARAEGTGWSLRIPLTTSPRYVRSDELTARHAQGQPLALLRDPGHRFRLNVILTGAGAVESPTHQLDLTREGNRSRVRLREGEIVPDRDCVLSWRPSQEANRAALQVLLHDDRDSGEVYFLALVAPPATHDRGRGVPREVVLLVDHSGSMHGPKWQAADWAVERFLSDLTERDAFALGLFHNKTRWFAKTVCPALAKEVKEAIHFLKTHKDDGGTELGVALEQALDLERSKGESARHILVITDAAVTDAGRILRLADQEAKRLDRRRISVLCIDAAPNVHLATELAERGGGVTRFLTSQPDQGDITTALDEVLADWAEPVLNGLRLEVNRRHVETTGQQLIEPAKPGLCAVDLGDLPAGRSVWMVGRVPRTESNDLAFSVTAREKWEIASWNVDLQQEGDMRPVFKALFGARRIHGLEQLIHSGYTGAELQDQLRFLGYDPIKVLAERPDRPTKVYQENVRSDVTVALRGLLIREALRYGLASMETAFVAIRTEAGRPVDKKVVIANALPAGWSEEFDALMGGVAFKAMLSAPRGGSGAFGVSMARSVALRSRSLAGFGTPETEMDELPTREPTVLFSGIPQFSGAQAILFDSSRTQDAKKLPDHMVIDQLRVRFSDASQVSTLDPGLCILIFVDDPASPRARVRLVDVIRQGGERPLNLLKQSGQMMRLILLDTAGSWTHGGPELEVALGWKTV
jgi:Ca-activated chloride channel family protein